MGVAGAELSITINEAAVAVPAADAAVIPVSAELPIVISLFELLLAIDIGALGINLTTDCTVAPVLSVSVKITSVFNAFD